MLVLAVTFNVSSSHGKLPAILKRDRVAGNQMRTVAGAKTLGREHVPRLDGVFTPALPVKNVRRTALEGPIHYFAARVLDVEIEIDVRIHELHFRDGSGKRQRLAVVKFNAESVVRHNGRRGEECRRKGQGREEGASHEFLQERFLTQFICQRPAGVKQRCRRVVTQFARGTATLGCALGWAPVVRAQAGVPVPPRGAFERQTRRPPALKDDYAPQPGAAQPSVAAPLPGTPRQGQSPRRKAQSKSSASPATSSTMA